MIVTVPDTGNRLTNGTNLQAAINAAFAGDILALIAGAEYRVTDGFNLPPKNGSDAITIRTAGITAPTATYRVDPLIHGPFAKLSSVNQPTIFAQLGVMNGGNTALTTQPAKHWTFQWLEIIGPDNGFGDIITFGYGAGNAGAHTGQYNILQVPEDFLIDRCYIHGDPIWGQKHGVDLNCGACTIRDSHISDCKHPGEDAQAVFGWNGPGPYTILNSYLEASGECFILGGADPAIPGNVPANLTFLHNDCFKPLAWMDPIQATPTNIAKSAGSGGSLTAGTKYMRLLAVHVVTENNLAISVASAEFSQVVGANGTIPITWTKPALATSHRLYVGTSAGVYAGYIAIGNVAAYTYTGAESVTADDLSGGVVAFDGTHWDVKNLFELKACDGALVQGNRFTNNWLRNQLGDAILFTVRNQDGTFPQAVVRNVLFRDNKIVNVGGGFQLLGADAPNASLQSDNIQILNNLWVISKTMSATAGQEARGGWARLLSGGTDAGVAPKNVVLDHNTAICEGGVTASVVVLGCALTSTGVGVPIVNCTITNNLLLHLVGGFFTGGLYGVGDTSINAVLPVSANRDVRKNTLAGGNPALYTSISADTFFPTVSDWQAQFVNFAGGDYRLAANPSPNLNYRTAGLNGSALGCDFVAIDAAYAQAHPAIRRRRNPFRGKG